MPLEFSSAGYGSTTWRWLEVSGTHAAVMSDTPKVRTRAGPLAAPELYDPARRAARVGDDDPTLSAVTLATGDQCFDELLALIITTVRRDVLPEPAG